MKPAIAARPGLWREVGGADALQLLDVAPVTPGMVVVGCKGEDWRRRPELRFQVWPDDLEPMPATAAATTSTPVLRAAV